jgi:hypothetical protein
VIVDGLVSDPETEYPSVNSTSAIPLMPIPPIPTMCMR